MPATLDIRELSDRVILRVCESRSLTRTLFQFFLGSLALGLFLYFAHTSRAVQIFFGTLAVFSIVKEGIGRIRGTNVTLEVTNLDLVSRGNAPDGYHPSSIPRASIYVLEFRKASGGGEEAPQPSGLYVEHYGILKNPVTCVLPHLNEAQTEQAITAILRRFPDTESLAPPKEPYQSELISLNLNK